MGIKGWFFLLVYRGWNSFFFCDGSVIGRWVVKCLEWNVNKIECCVYIFKGFCWYFKVLMNGKLKGNV